MCEHAGHPVSQLERIGFGPLELWRPASRLYRELGAEEVERLAAASAGEQLVAAQRRRCEGARYLRRRQRTACRRQGA